MVIENPRQQSNGSTKEIKGRTLWDAVVEIFIRLGKGAPYVLILAGSVYAVYIFLQLSEQRVIDLQKGYEEAAKTYQEQVKVANDAVVKSYTAIGTINDSQIRNLNAMLDLQKKAASEFRETFQKNEQLVKQMEEQRTKFEQEKRDLAKDLAVGLDTATATLAAVGTLIDDAPELLRAIATTDVIQNIIQKSDSLLLETEPTPDLKYRKAQILLAFADLQDFLGASGSQQRLASEVVKLIGNVRNSDREFPEIDANEATAHLILGAALAAQNELDRAIDEMNKSIRGFDAALRTASTDSRIAKLRERKAEAYQKLGKAVERLRHNREDALRNLQSAVDICDALVNQDQDDPARTQCVAYSHMQIAEIELDHRNVDSASREYDLARQLMEQIAPLAYLNNEWLDHLARVYNGSAPLIVSPANLLWRQRLAEGSDTSPAATPEIDQLLKQAQNYLKRANDITARLAKDKRNLAWQSVHAWSKHNLGEVQLLRGELMLPPSDLKDSLVTFREALDIRKQLLASEPTRRDWLMDVRWTEINLHTSEAIIAERAQDYNGMASLFSKNVQLIDEALAEDPDSDQWHYRRGDNRASYADALARLKRYQEAREAYADVRAKAVARIKVSPEEAGKGPWRQLIYRVDQATARLPAASVQ